MLMSFGLLSGVSIGLTIGPNMEFHSFYVMLLMYGADMLVTVTLNCTVVGNVGCHPNIKKDGINPVAELCIQL